MTEQSSISGFLEVGRDAVFEQLTRYIENPGTDAQNMRFSKFCPSPDLSQDSPDNVSLLFWFIEVDIELEGWKLIVEIFPKEAPRHAWFRTKDLSFSYRSDSGDAGSVPNDLLTPIKERILDREEAHEAELSRRIDGFFPFAHLQDRHFALYHQHHGHKYGHLWLTYACNHRCRFCWQSPEWPVPPTEFYERWIRELLQLGVHGLCFSGGEPTLRDDLLKLIKLASTPALRPRFRDVVTIILETNGQRLSDESYVKDLVAAGLNQALIGLHGSTAEISDHLTQTPGAFRDTVQAIHNCLKHKLEVNIQCLVDKDNLADLEAHARFIVREFIADSDHGLLRQVTYNTPIPFADPARYQTHGTSQAALQQFLPAIQATLTPHNVEVTVKGG